MKYVLIKCNPIALIKPPLNLKRRSSANEPSITVLGNMRASSECVDSCRTSSVNLTTPGLIEKVEIEPNDIAIFVLNTTSVA